MSISSPYQSKIDQLQQFLISASNSETPTLNNGDVHKILFELIMNGIGMNVYDLLTKVIEDFTNSIAIKVKELHEDDLLHGFSELWNRARKLEKTIRDSFWYLNDHLGKLSEEKKEGHLQPTQHLILLNFSNKVLLKSNLVDRICRKLLDEYQKHREKQNIDENNLHNLGKMFVAYTEIEGNTLYLDHFEKPFLAATKEYYRIYGNRYSTESETNLYGYCVMVGEQMKHESTQYFYLLRGTKESIQSILVDTLIVSHYTDLLSRNTGGFSDVMSQDDKNQKLRVIFDIFKTNIDSLNALAETYYNFVLKVSTEFIANDGEWEKPVLWGEKYIALFSAQQELVNYSFRYHKFCEEKRIAAFRDSLRRQTAPCTALALHLDSRLREKIGTLSAEQQKELINTSLEIFQLLDDKDVFKEEYEQCLKKRLLDAKIQSDDFETNILTGLTDKAGKTFTDTAYVLRQEYAQEHEKVDPQLDSKLIGKLSVPIKPTILMESAWKFGSQQPINNAPPFFAGASDVFGTYYIQMHGEKKIRPIYSEGNVQATIQYTSRSYDVTLTTPQAFILDLVQNGKTKVSEIIQTLTISEVYLSDFNMQIRSLTTAPKKQVSILLEDSDHNLSFNMSFSNPRNKFHILVPAKKVKVAKEVTDNLQATRDNQLDAAIVRVMKTRNTATLQSLETSVIAMVNKFFIPKPQDFKHRIDVLIDKEYMRRDDKDNSLFHYVA